MMDDLIHQRVLQVEQACYELYERNLQSSNTLFTEDSFDFNRKQAEEWLDQVTKESQSLLLCREILINSQSFYAKVFAAQTLTKLIGNFHTLYSLEDRLCIRDFIVSFLVGDQTLKASTLKEGLSPPVYPNVLKNTLGQAWARLTRLSFWDHDSFRNAYEFIVDRFMVESSQSEKIFTDSYHGYLREMGINLFHHLIVEMSSIDEHATYSSRHQKTAIGFRDTQLMKIFKSCISLIRLWVSHERLRVPDDKGSSDGYIMTALVCFKDVMKFDFIGTSADESSDDVNSIQIPSSWRTIFEEGFEGDTFNQGLRRDHLSSDLMISEMTEHIPLVNLLYRLYDITYSDRITLSSLTLDCLSLCASIRRSLFLNEVRRATSIRFLIAGMTEILQVHSTSLKIRENYEAWCRLLAKIRVSYTFSEVIADPGYQLWIALVNDFSITSFRSLWLWSPNSLPLLLAFWSRMITSSNYGSDELPHRLELVIPNLCRAFIQSVWDIEASCREISAFLNDPFPIEEVDELLHEASNSFESFGILARYQYKSTATDLISLLDILKQSSQMSQEYFRRAIWLIDLVTACLSCGGAHFQSDDKEDAIDGELAANIFILNRFIERRLSLDSLIIDTIFVSLYKRSLMNFFEEARKCFVGDHAVKRSQAYKKLSEITQFKDQESLIDFLLSYSITLIQHQKPPETELVSSALRLFSNFTCDYSTLRMLNQLAHIRHLMTTHEQEEFYPTMILNLTRPHHHVLLYQIFGRLLMLDEREAPETEFHRFFSPFTSYAQKLTRMSDRELVEPVTKSFIIGLYSNFRGFVSVMNTTSCYSLFLDWYLRSFANVTDRVSSCLMKEEKFSTALLRFMNELVQNRSQRVKFDLLSANVILLFRNVSKLVVLYSQVGFLMKRSISKDLWLEKYKGLHLCMEIFRATLSGSYVPFGVFSLYNDLALDHLIDSLWSMLLETPLSDLFAYPKLILSFVRLMEIFAKDYFCRLPDVKETILVYIFASISKSLDQSIDRAISSSACSILDELMTVTLKCTMENKSHFIQRFLDAHRDIVPYFLRLLFFAVVYDENSRNLGQWSYSRPLLILILLDEQAWNQLSQDFIQIQPPDLQQILINGFRELMEDITKVISLKNRDKFTLNLSLFRRDLPRHSLRPLSQPKNPFEVFWQKS